MRRLMHLLGLLLLLPLANCQDFALWSRAGRAAEVRLGRAVREASATSKQWTSAICRAAGEEAECRVQRPTLKRALGSATEDFSLPNLIPSSVTGTCEEDLLFFLTALYNLTQIYASMPPQPPPSCRSPECNANRTRAAQLGQEIQTKYIWVLRQFDANGKPGSGVLEGNTMRLGDYHECLSISVPRPDTTDYQTKQCFAIAPVATAFTSILPRTGSGGVGAEKSLRRSVVEKATATATAGQQGHNQSACNDTSAYNAAVTAYCLPSSCNNDEAFALLTFIYDTKLSSLCSASCHDRSYSLTTGAAVVIAVLAFFAVLSLIAAFVDYNYYTPTMEAAKEDWEKDNGLFMRFLMSFSLYSNGRRILDATRKPGQIDCLHGIRFLSMSWVIMGHSYSTLSTEIDNFLPLLQLPKHILNETIFNATFSVDSFFLMSGLLVAFLWLKAAHKSKGKMVRSPLTWILYYVHRYLRLTPLYVLVVAVYIYLSPYIIRGPTTLNPTDNAIEKVCAKSWWTNVLYINNLVYAKAEEQCYGVAWYLSNDMQFYVFAPCLLLLFYFVPVAGLAIGGGLVFFSMLLGAGITAFFYLPAITTFNPWNDPRAVNASKILGLDPGNVSWELMYTNPLVRLQPYVIGMCLGWLFNARPKLRIPRLAALVGWLVAAVVALAILYGGWDTSRGIHLEVWVRALYAGVSRCLWSLALGWVILACHYGSGSWLNDLLSWSGFVPLSRLTYCTYLLHITIATWLGLSHDRRMHWNGHWVHLATYYLPMLVATMLISFFVSAMIEVPISNVETLLLGGGRRKGAKPAAKPTVHPATPSSEGRSSAFDRPSLAKPSPPTTSESSGSRPTSLARSAEDEAPLVMSPLRLHRLSGAAEQAWAVPQIDEPYGTAQPNERVVSRF